MIATLVLCGVGYGLVGLGALAATVLVGEAWSDEDYGMLVFMGLLAGAAWPVTVAVFLWDAVRHAFRGVTATVRKGRRDGRR